MSYAQRKMHLAQRLTGFLLGMTLVLGVQDLSAEPSAFESVRPLVRTNKVDEALKVLPNPDTMSGEEKGLALFLKGRLLYAKAQLAEARPFFETALKAKDFRLTGYALYHLGLIDYASKDFKAARKNFESALKENPTRDLQSLIQFQMADMALEQKHFDEASSLLRKLEKRWKRDVRYPEVLYRELRVELKRGRSARGCQLARKLYSEFPGHTLVATWPVDLRKARVDDKTLGCLMTSKDQTRRTHRLQWAGMSDRARAEIDELRGQDKEASPHFDFMLAQFLVSEGLVDEALQLLLKHYETYKRNFNYLTLLARAAARAGEYQTAVGAYYKAYQLAGGSRVGREALFQSAFLSYQFQDYDGASRKFEEFVHRFSRSGLSRDARWNLSWIRYLKGDYLGAYKGFNSIAGQLPRSRKRKKISSDRIRYWQAMSLLRLERVEEAKTLFQSLINDKSIGFYAQAAGYRLEMLKPKGMESPVAAASSAVESAQADSPGSEIESAENSEAEESEDTMTITKEDSEENEESGEEEEKIEVTSSKNPQLVKAFERAQDLIRLGFYDWARFELFEIESHTRNKTYLTNLMALYEKIDSFNRSSTIADLQFAGERTREGIEKSKDLWSLAYPEAYKTSVIEAARSFGIPPEYVWSIMRAESQYKFDVISPVGAKGLMQLMPQTGANLAKILGRRDFAESQLFEPATNILLGAKYLSRLAGKFENSLPLIAAAYNAGPHRVESWLVSFGTLEMDEFIEHIPFVETRDYAKKVVRNFGLYQRIYKGDSRSLSWLAKPIAVKAPKKASARETWEI